MPRYRSKSWRAYRPGDPGAAPPPSEIPAAPLQRATVRPTVGAVRILGLDPGSRRTGYGIVEIEGSQLRCITHGRIEVDGLPLAERLSRIHAELRALITQHRPAEVAIERVFLSRNVESALKLGQARGAALAAIGADLELAEYAPRAVKLATVGFGGADKLQIAHMVRALLSPEGRLTSDAADALAIALCHVHHRRLAGLLARQLG